MAIGRPRRGAGNGPASVRPAEAPPRRRLELEARREELLSAAFTIFVERGFDAVSMEDVARAAGASKGLLYHYFPTKRHLYRAAVQRGADLLLARTATPDDTPPLERLEVGLAAYFAYVQEHAAAYEALMRSGLGDDPELDAIVDATRDAIAERVLSGLPLAGVAPGPAVQAAVRGFIGFVEAVALRWLRDRALDRATLERTSIAVLLAAVGAVGEGAGAGAGAGAGEGEGEGAARAGR